MIIVTSKNKRGRNKLVQNMTAEPTATRPLWCRPNPLMSSRDWGDFLDRIASMWLTWSGCWGDDRDGTFSTITVNGRSYLTGSRMTSDRMMGLLRSVRYQSAWIACMMCLNHTLPWMNSTLPPPQQAPKNPFIVLLCVWCVGRMQDEVWMRKNH